MPPYDREKPVAEKKADPNVTDPTTKTSDADVAENDKRNGFTDDDKAEAPVLDPPVDAPPSHRSGY